MAEQAIKLNTVGEVGAGQYAGWYVIVVPKQAEGFEDSYTVYVCTDTTFAFNPAERECYDEWVINAAFLAGLFEDKYIDVVWDESIAPPQFTLPAPETTRLIERFRARVNSDKATDSDEHQQS